MIENQFHLPSPENFRGLHPDIPIKIYQRRLPHWRQSGATYFVTFRLADSIPQDKLRALKRWREIWERSHPEPRTEEHWHTLAREITNRTEAWLDEGYGQCVFRSLPLARVMSNALHHFQGKSCYTSCLTVMPNHVYAVIKPIGELPLEQLLGKIKRFVARKVNTELNLTGQLWEEESYDRIIRDEEHLYRVVQYIGKNPAKAGIPKSQWVRWIHPDWESNGWNFRDP